MSVIMAMAWLTGFPLGREALLRCNCCNTQRRANGFRIGPEGIAFAVKWPLNMHQVWGNIPFRRKPAPAIALTTYL